MRKGAICWAISPYRLWLGAEGLFRNLPVGVANASSGSKRTVESISGLHLADSPDLHFCLSRPGHQQSLNADGLARVRLFQALVLASRACLPGRRFS